MLASLLEGKGIEEFKGLSPTALSLIISNGQTANKKKAAIKEALAEVKEFHEPRRKQRPTEELFPMLGLGSRPDLARSDLAEFNMVPKKVH